MNRLPKDKKSLPQHKCYFLKIKDVIPEYWIIPTNLKRVPAQQLPRRATYKPKYGDIFLSRFREPLGKCVIYLGEPEPLYVSNNFVLLRPKPNVSSLFILAMLKSSFLICQLRRIILRRTLWPEMYIRDVPKIKLPNLQNRFQEQIIQQTEKCLEAEIALRLTGSKAENRRTNLEERTLAMKTMMETDTLVDEIITNFQRQISQR